MDVCNFSKIVPWINLRNAAQIVPIFAEVYNRYFWHTLIIKTFSIYKKDTYKL